MSNLETNIRIAKPGLSLYVVVRRISVTGQSVTADLLELACGRLRSAQGLAAIPDPMNQQSLLVATGQPVPTLKMTDMDWEITVDDTGDPPCKLHFTDDPTVVTAIVERSLLTRVARETKLWFLDSRRIWYEGQPFRADDDIAAYRRFELGAVPINGVGVGVVADVGTAFFATQTLDYFFAPGLPSSERAHRQARFETISGRQEGQKGTLLYDNGSSKTSCYFEEAPVGLTCNNSGGLVVRGRTYDSLYEYYRSQYPDLDVGKDDQAVRVSFRGIDRPQPVAAHLLRPRVMNKNLPRSMSSVDKIAPGDRRCLLTKFWESLEPRPLGHTTPGLIAGFWRPEEQRVYRFTPPIVRFGDSLCVPQPRAQQEKDYRPYYKRRLDLMESGHCYRLHPTASRTICFAYPATVKEAAECAADDITTTLKRWTNKPFRSELLAYGTANEAYDRIRAQEKGIVIFVLNDEPGAYYDASFNLPGWRVKRITELTLKHQFDALKSGVWDRREKRNSIQAGQRRWESFIGLNSLDVLQQLDGVPFSTEDLGKYDAQLVIDVGYDRKFFAVSLLIARDSAKTPNFGIYTRVHHKVDSKKEMVNSTLLKDAIADIVDTAMVRPKDPLQSLLIFRDGKIQESELPGIDGALEMLRQRGVLDSMALVDIVGFHKTSLKNIRLWDVDGGVVSNPLEGTGVSLNPHTFVLCSTGRATLTQGTADPLTLATGSRNANLPAAAYSAFAAAQLNWSSPRVAQRYPLPLKRTDEELEARAAQEIRRIR